MQKIICFGVRVSPQTTINDAVIMTGARTGPRSYVERAIIGPYAVFETGSIS